MGRFFKQLGVVKSMLQELRFFNGQDDIWIQAEW